MNKMKQTSIVVVDFTGLSKEAMDVAINTALDSGIYDYSCFDQRDYEFSLKRFEQIFKSQSHLFHESDINLVEKSLLNIVLMMAQHQARDNKYYAESFQKNYNSMVSSKENAIELLDGCILTGVCIDFCLTDTLVEFLKGSKHQGLSLGELFITAKREGKKQLIKDYLNTYKKKSYIKEKFIEDAVMFFKNGVVVDEDILDKVA